MTTVEMPREVAVIKVSAHTKSTSACLPDISPWMGVQMQLTSRKTDLLYMTEYAVLR